MNYQMANKKIIIKRINGYELRRSNGNNLKVKSIKELNEVLGK